MHARYFLKSKLYSFRLYVKGIQDVGAAVRTTTAMFFLEFNSKHPAVLQRNHRHSLHDFCRTSRPGYRCRSMEKPGRQHSLLPPCGRCHEVINQRLQPTGLGITTRPKLFVLVYRHSPARRKTKSYDLCCSSKGIHLACHTLQSWTKSPLKLRSWI